MGGGSSGKGSDSVDDDGGAARVVDARSVCGGDEADVAFPEVVAKAWGAGRQSGAEGRAGWVLRASDCGAHLVDEAVEVVVGERVADEQHVSREQHGLDDAREGDAFALETE